MVVDAGAVPIFVHLLSSPHDNVQEQAIWALGNIAGDSTELRNFVLNQGILPPLLTILTNAHRLSMTQNAVWALSNLCRGKNPPVDFAQVNYYSILKAISSVEKFMLLFRCHRHWIFSLSYCSTPMATFCQMPVGQSVTCQMGRTKKFRY